MPQRRFLPRLGPVLPAFIGLLLGSALLWGEGLHLGETALAPSPSAAAVPEDTPFPAPTPAATATPTVAEASAQPTATSAPATSTPAAKRPAPPTRLRIPSLRIDAPIVPVGITADGELEAPSEGHQVGWFSRGIRPGEVGNALLDGHVDWQRALAVFWYLGNIRPGDEVIVVTETGDDLRFGVTWKELVPVAGAPLERIFGPTEESALTLITCGGSFDRNTRSYTHRWVVRAVLRDSTAAGRD